MQVGTYVYVQSEAHLWTVGHYDDKGKWHPESDHDSKTKAATRVHFMNGGIPLMLLERFAYCGNEIRDAANVLHNTDPNRSYRLHKLANMMHKIVCHEGKALKFEDAV